MFGEEPHASLGWDGHLLLLFHSESERQVALAAWVRRGLELHEKVVCAELDHTSDVLAGLGDHLDVGAATASGQLEVVSGQELRPSELGRLVDRALAEHPALRLAPVVRSTRTFVPEDELAETERAIDEVCRTRPVSALCQYDGASTQGAVLQQVASAHLKGVREAHLNTSELDGQLVIAGELDIGNGDLLTCMLRAASDAASEAASGTLLVGMSRVTFLSVVAARALVEGTQQFRDHGGELRLVAPPADVEWFLRALGVDSLPHVELVEEAVS